MKKFISILIVFMPFLGIAQKQGNIWYFGDHTGLNFNSGVVVALTNGATYNSGPSSHSEGTAVISDSSGSLLFYTNGQQIWNKNHQVMPNGDSLLGHWSSTQAALIVPKPGSNRYFYIFTTDAFYQDSLKHGFRYSIVDICLDNGFGDIMSNQKNIKLLDTVAEKLTAVRHANGIDYWVITHKYFSDAFYAYHLSSSGVVDTVISHIGSRHPAINSNQGISAAIGQLSSSPDGSRIAIVNGNAGAHSIAECFNFDKNTGNLSNYLSVQTDTMKDYYGVSFSPDNSKLYITTTMSINGIYQFDLKAGSGNPDSVLASKFQIPSNGMYCAMQLGADGKIYLAKAGQYLSTINNPNNSGPNCNYKDSAIYLNGKTASFGLPNFINSYDYSNAIYDCGVGVKELNKNRRIEIFPNPSTGNFTIQTQNAKITDIEIFNVLGEIVYTTNPSSPLNSTEVDISTEPEGVYFVRLRFASADTMRVGTEEGFFSKRVVLVR